MNCLALLLMYGTMTMAAEEPLEIGTFRVEYRMHPFAAAVVRQQLKGLDERNALVQSNVRKLNDRLLQLPGLSEPRRRPDQKRVYYHANMLFLDEAKAGFSRAALLKALKAEGVRVSIWDYPLQHKYKIYFGGQLVAPPAADSRGPSGF